MSCKKILVFFLCEIKTGESFLESDIFTYPLFNYLEKINAISNGTMYRHFLKSVFLIFSQKILTRLNSKEDISLSIIQNNLSDKSAQTILFLSAYKFDHKHLQKND